MFILLLKTTTNACTSLDFVGGFSSREDAVRHIDREFGELMPSGFGNYRMLGARGKDPKVVEETKLWNGSTYVLAEY